MEAAQVISKVTKPTPWVNSMVVVQKKDKIRICLDPKDLNKAIKREHYPMRNLDDIAVKMKGAMVYSVLDASSGFWQIPVDKASSDLLTFNTPFGRYKFLRLPFGICSAPEIFQRYSSEVFGNHPSRDVSMDDVILWGTNQQEHDKLLKETLQIAREENLKLRKEKSQIGVDKVTYVGHEFGINGIRPTNSHVTAVTSMPAPTTKKELQRFLGMINYMAKFVPNLSTITEPLRQLLKNNIAWVWSYEQEANFNKLKELLVTRPILSYYQPERPLLLSVDASSTGLGACILQEGKAIAYASRTLTPCEQNYAQIEREMLAIVFGATKFHQYVYGRSTEVETDHRPLESIFKKPLVDITPRLQKMALKLQKYSLVVHYEPGKNLKIADALSRAPQSTQLEHDEIDNFEIHTVDQLPISPKKLEQIKEAMNSDIILKKIALLVTTGWPTRKQNVDPALSEYWQFHTELSIDNGILLRGHRIIPPKALRIELINKIHSSHLGVDKCISRARELFFWPNMKRDIEAVVSKCETCNYFQPKQPKEPMFLSALPHLPWEKVSVDLYHCFGEDFLIITDFYSKFYEIDKLTSLTSQHIIETLKKQFGRHGIPKQLVGDNGPQFDSIEFAAFAKLYGFHHTTSSPRYPKGNGSAERAVQEAKHIIKKCHHAGTDLYLALLEARNTPIDETGSPAQRLMGRRTNTALPIKEALLHPTTISPTKVQSSLKQQQLYQKKYYDRGAQPLPKLQAGDKIRMRTEQNTWIPAEVQKEASTPRSYVVRTESGTMFRRNRVDLRPRWKRGYNTDEPLVQSLPDTNTGDQTRSEQLVPVTERWPRMDEAPENYTVKKSTSSNGTAHSNYKVTRQDKDLGKTRSGRVIKKPVKFKDFKL